MGRTERLHPRQAEIDRILLENTGKGSYETVLRLLGEAGIDPVDLSVSGQSIPDSARISKVKDEAKRRASKRASRPKLVELAEYELSRVYHGADQTMLTIWLSQLILNMRPGRNDPAHNSLTLPLFENYLSELFGCDLSEVWEVVDEWVRSLTTQDDASSHRVAAFSTSYAS